MERYAVGELVDLQSFFTSMHTALAPQPPHIKSGFDYDQMALIRSKAERYAALLGRLNLHVSADSAHRVICCLDGAEPGEGKLVVSGQNRADLMAALRLLSDIVGREMGTKHFLILSAEKVKYFDQAEPLFGNEVSDAFPAAMDDISEAGMCFALSRYTGVVFHLMRALEVAVHVLATRLGVTTKDKHGVDLAWGPIVANISDAAKMMPKGDEKNRISETVALLVNVKEAWRNTTMHPKHTYTEDQAKAVLDAVSSFMRQLASLA